MSQVFLHLGVVDVPYADVGPGGKKAKKKDTGVTTGDVADILEAKYHIMETFFELHKEEIIDDYTESFEGAIESLLMGAPVEFDPAGEGSSRVEQRFKDFISNREMESLGIPGVPTQAALDGVDHRKKQPFAKRPPRPSFRDTGQYSAAMKSWLETESS